MLAQRLERVTDGGCGDAKHDRQLILDGQLLAPTKKSERDCGREAINNCLSTKDVREWPENLGLNTVQDTHVTSNRLNSSITIL